MGRGILRGAGGDENLKSNFIWPYLNLYKLFILQSPGKKDLVIDGDLMKPLDRIASVSLLKVCY